jgi:peptidoglycan-N-acetylglucosamine deacetylase
MPSIYLSFDDGPHPQYTPPLLDLLRSYDAKGTFFLIGDRVEMHPDITRRIIDEGHAIGNHSMTHPKLEKLTGRKQLLEVERADAVLSPFNGKTRQLFRPPNGRATMSTIVSSIVLSRPLVLWSVDSRDYCLAADEVVRRLEATIVRAGDILLFHDDIGVAEVALRRLLPRWRDAGLNFGTL